MSILSSASGFLNSLHNECITNTKLNSLECWTDGVVGQIESRQEIFWSRSNDASEEIRCQFLDFQSKHRTLLLKIPFRDRIKFVEEIGKRLVRNTDEIEEKINK